MPVFRKIRGTIETIFQIGLSGPNLKNNSGVIEAKNAGDSAFADFGAADIVLNDGGTAVRLKENAGVLEFKDNADSALIIVRGLTPVGTTDLTTKAYVDAAAGAVSSVKMVRFLIAQSASTDSTFQLPANSRVVKVQVDVTTQYDNAATLTVGNTAGASAFMAVGDSDLLATNMYVKDMDVDSGVLDNVTAVLTGTPTVGAASILVHYVETPSA